MGDKISEVLDSMTAGELAALEGELDKRAGELAVGHYYNLGVEAARREFASFKGSGELTPLLHLVKSAVEPPDGKIRAKFKEMAQGKATTQELKDVAVSQSGKEAAESDKDEEKEEEKKEDEKSEKKLPPWLKSKGKDEEKSEKDDDEDKEEKSEKKDKDEGKDEDEKESLDLNAFIDKASAKELEEFEKALDGELLVREYAAYYADCGRKIAHEIMKKEAVPLVSRAMSGIGSMFSKSTRGGQAMRQTFATLAKHPTAVAATGAGVGGYLLGRQ
jgi:hypothetical protein